MPKAEALKIEGANESHLEVIKVLTQNGIPVVGHIGLTPQSVHEQGGYYTHGKDESSATKLLSQAKDLQRAGACMVVLECVESKLSKVITEELSIPTIVVPFVCPYLIEFTTKLINTCSIFSKSPSTKTGNS